MDVREMFAGLGENKKGGLQKSTPKTGKEGELPNGKYPGKGEEP